MLNVNVSALCDDPSILVKAEKMDHIIILTMLKYQIVRDTLPKSKPLRHIRTFEEFCKICMFPFVEIVGSDDVP